MDHYVSENEYEILSMRFIDKLHYSISNSPMFLEETRAGDAKWEKILFQLKRVIPTQEFWTQESPGEEGGNGDKGGTGYWQVLTSP